MKLLLLCFYYPPDLGAGAFRTSAFVEQLLRMKQQGVQIDLITTLPNRYASFTADAPLLEEYPGLCVRRLPVPKHRSGFLGQSWAFLHYARQVLLLVRHEKYKVVYATSSRLMIATLAAFIAQRQHATLFLDIRDLFVDTLGDILPKRFARLFKPLFARIEYWTLSKAEHVNIVSKGFEPYIQQRFPNKKLSYFTNGIDKDFLHLNFRAAHHASDQFTILYAGNIGEGQGLERIIPFLAQRLEGCARIKIIGDGGKKRYLEQLLQSFGCTNVELIPPIQRQALLQAYEEADVLLLHLNDCQAFRKVLPSKIFEYAATGKPILAGVAGYAAEFIRSEIANAFVFQPCDTDDAIRELAKLNFVIHDRDVFIKKYQREEIMQMMAKELMAYF